MALDVEYNIGYFGVTFMIVIHLDSEHRDSSEDRCKTTV